MDYEVERLRARFKLCNSQIAKAKAELSFWSRELGFAVRGLQDCDQHCFEFFSNEVKTMESVK